MTAPVSVLPIEGTTWFRLSYEVVEGDGIAYITPAGGPLEGGVWYQPLAIPPPAKQPRRAVEWQGWPHTHLARLNPRRTEDVLEFTVKWGLLGLWNVKSYQKWPWPWWGEFKSEDINVHYVNPAGKGPYRYREPVEAFRMAAEEFQHFISLAAGERAPGYRHAPKTPEDRKSAAQDILNRFLRDCHPVTWYTGPKGKWYTFWQVPSLLHCCYLLAWLELTGLREWRRCAHRPCGRFFVAVRPNERFCSEQCGDNSKRLAYYYRRKEK